ncbi:MAG TPA: hypothetical protein VL133_15065 [Devosia sp.]|jgi:hypothetical protein|nr:hypothetical protein [Devosia sp.]HTN64087.1 hypothetical protein [Devosia sp.]
MAKRSGNRELKKPKQVKDKAAGAMTISDLSSKRAPKAAERK